MVGMERKRKGREGRRRERREEERRGEEEREGEGRAGEGREGLTEGWKWKERVGQEGTNEFQTALSPRELYCGKSEDSVGGNRDDNSAHCEGRQERFGEDFAL